MRAKKFYGQHFLRDESVVDAIIAAADLAQSDTVLEIGPGEGVMTECLVTVAKKVVAIDIDADAIKATGSRVKAENLKLVHEDVLKLSPSDLDELLSGEDYVMVGNIPYNITSDLLNKFLSQGKRPLRSVWMVQREVADRMMARDGKMSMMGLLVGLYADVAHVANVPRDAFMPPPKVDSAVVKLHHLTPQDMKTRGYDKPEAILGFAKIGFSAKRKKLTTTLSALPNVPKDALETALEGMGFSQGARPEELSVDQWVQLYKVFNETACI